LGGEFWQRGWGATIILGGEKAETVDFQKKEGEGKNVSKKRALYDPRQAGKGGGRRCARPKRKEKILGSLRLKRGESPHFCIRLGKKRKRGGVPAGRKIQA